MRNKEGWTLDDSKAIPPLPLIELDDDKAERKLTVEEALKEIDKLSNEKKKKPG